MSIAVSRAKIIPMKKTITYTAGPSDAGLTIEQFLKSQGYSQRLLIHLKNTPGGICLGAVPVRTNRRLSADEQFTVTLIEEPPSQNIVPVPMELDIVYEDEDLLIINKKANVPVHPSQGNYDNTLANGIAYYNTQKQTPFVFRPVNRLDRDTTGLLIVAKHMLSAGILSGMVINRQIRRKYLAVALGLVPEAGTITAPIARLEGSVIERCVDEAHGEYACTHYRRLLYCPASDCSLVSLRLDTGRTHQIRVHMRHIGHPLPGDFLYCPDFRLIRRQALHSCRLTFPHPVTGQLLDIHAPLPEDMRQMLQIGTQPTP